MFTHPLDGLTEIAGVATLEPWRRRGIGAAVTHAAAALAFSRGVSAVLLSAADERAGRVYGGVGFRPAGNVLVFGERRGRKLARRLLVSRRHSSTRRSLP